MRARTLGALVACALSSFSCAREAAIPDAHDALPQAKEAPPVCPIGGCTTPERDDPSADAAAKAAACATPVACAAAAASACKDDEPKKCREQALTLWSTSFGTRALGRIAALFDRACAHGDAEGCHYSGRLLLDGKGVARDATRAIANLGRACDADFAMACSVLAQHFAPASASSNSVPPYLQRYGWQYACVTGDSGQCYELGRRYQDGSEGFPKDPARAAIFYAKACSLDNLMSCSLLGELYYFGLGVERDAARAAELYRRACSAGEAVGCSNLGLLYEYGDGVTVDLAHARELYTDGCNSASGAFACLHLQMLDAYAHGVPHDPVLSRARWKASCDATGSGPECAYVALLYGEGLGGARDEATQTMLMRRACHAKLALACEWEREQGR